MSRKLNIAYFAHSLRSDWNNGNAHFLRGLVRALGRIGHQIRVFEPASSWSIENLGMEPLGDASLQQFERIYSDLFLVTYSLSQLNAELLGGLDIVLMHEWNDPQLATRLLELRGEVEYKLLFHDTHHRASSTPEQIDLFGITQFDGVVAFGEALSAIYRERYGLQHVWTLHEAADTSIFYPRTALSKETDVVWIGNWGEGERSGEIHDYLLKPAKQLWGEARFTIYGVRYPEDGVAALKEAKVRYGGYLPNLDAPGVYAGAKLTLHIPRQQYVGAMTGIPTIRVFEALASGIPLISAPWLDSEGLFKPGDYMKVSGTVEMTAAIRLLLQEPEVAADQARQGLERVLARHTCTHRARQLTAICEEVLS